MEKLSSGYRINRAADDAAGLAISEKMRGQIGGLAQAQRNAQDGISLVQTAEGALNEVHSMLQRVRDLKVQFDNGTLERRRQGRRSRAEVLEIAKEVKSIVSDTKFNGKALFGQDGVHVPGRRQHRRDDLHRRRPTSSGGLAAGGLSELTDLVGRRGRQRGAVAPAARFASLATIDDAIENVSKVRGNFGAVQNRLEHRLANLATYQENLTASESRIRDVDMASEMTKFTKLNILQQAGTSMLAQANQAPQGVLSLLR